MKKNKFMYPLAIIPGDASGNAHAASLTGTSNLTGERNIMFRVCKLEAYPITRIGRPRSRTRKPDY